MLQLSPELLAYLRSAQAETDAKLAMAADKAGRGKPKLRRLNKDRRQHFVETIACLMKAAKESGAAATPLNFEGPCRHGLRTRLTLEGWRWQDADAVAAEIVATALNRMGAERPTWAEGQPEWAHIGAGALIERTRCVRCHSPLEGIQRKFCSEMCANAHHSHIAAVAAQADGAAYSYVVGSQSQSNAP